MLTELLVFVKVFKCKLSDFLLVFHCLGTFEREISIKLLIRLYYLFQLWNFFIHVVFHHIKAFIPFFPADYNSLKNVTVYIQLHTNSKRSHA